MVGREEGWLPQKIGGRGLSHKYSMEDRDNREMKKKKNYYYRDQNSCAININDDDGSLHCCHCRDQSWQNA